MELSDSKRKALRFLRDNADEKVTRIWFKAAYVRMNTVYSLMREGLVKDKLRNVGQSNRSCYFITAAGRKALAKSEQAEPPEDLPTVRYFAQTKWKKHKRIWFVGDNWNTATKAASVCEAETREELKDKLLAYMRGLGIDELKLLWKHTNKVERLRS